MNCFRYCCLYIIANLNNFALCLLLNGSFRASCFPPFYKKIVMSDEHIESLQSSMHFRPTRLPKIVLQRVEEEFSIWREIIVSAMYPCADKITISSYFEDLYGPNNKMFPRNLMLPYIFCGLIF